MEIQLIQGEFNSSDAMELLTKMIHEKIKYHENKIARDSSEEDIKFRESKIKKLQKELYDVRKYVDGKVGNVTIDAIIRLENK
jgi:hypothetical protein